MEGEVGGSASFKLLLSRGRVCWTDRGGLEWFLKCMEDITLPFLLLSIDSPVRLPLPAKEEGGQEVRLGQQEEEEEEGGEGEERRREGRREGLSLCYCHCRRSGGGQA